MENYIKLVSKENLSEDSRKSFISLVQQYDAKAKMHSEESASICVSINASITEKDIKEIADKWSEHSDNFLIECEFEKADLDVFNEDDLKDMFDEMNEELNMRLHDRMVEEKAQKGWHYGEVYNPSEKLSPMMRPYHDLPDLYKKPNKNILRDVLNVLEGHGFMLVHKKKISK